jgi:hypothetical protein
MNTPATPSKNRALLTVFQQHWENARHIKNERLSFTNIYAIVSAGILSLLHSIRGEFVLEISLLDFLGCFSVIGLLTSLRLKAELENCLHSIEQTVARLGMEQFIPVVDARRALTRYPKFCWLFPAFLAIASAGFIGLLIHRVSSGAGGKQANWLMS